MSPVNLLFGPKGCFKLTNYNACWRTLTYIWYQLCGLIGVDEFENRFSPTKAIITLNPVSLTLYGTLHLDEINNVVKLHTRFIARTAKDIANYYS
jgi:hypothetical protein